MERRSATGDIGDYLSRSQKLAIIEDSTIESDDWVSLSPNEHHDWLNQRDSSYGALIPLANEPDAIFSVSSLGVATGRDTWVYNASLPILRSNIQRLVDFYNYQLDVVRPSIAQETTKKAATEAVKGLVNRDDERMKWIREDYGRLASGETYRLDDSMLRTAQYRPFLKQHLGFAKSLNAMRYQIGKLYPRPDTGNVGVSLVDPGNTCAFAALATASIPDLVLVGDKHSKHFARWRYEQPLDDDTLFGESSEGWVSNLNPAGVKRFRHALGDDIDDDAVFAYVYGVLHSPDFRREFETSLKKEAPRVPLVDDRATFDAFVKAGQQLLDLHVNYEEVEPYPLEEQWREGADPTASPELLLVGTKKMAYPKVPDAETGKKVPDKTRLVYNPHLTLAGIPPEAPRVRARHSLRHRLVDRSVLRGRLTRSRASSTT